MRMTSSPGSMYASAIMKIACLVGVMRTFEALQGTPSTLFSISATASLSSGMPVEGV